MPELRKDINNVLIQWSVVIERHFFSDLVLGRVLAGERYVHPTKYSTPMPYGYRRCWKGINNVCIGPKEKVQE